MAWLRLLCDKLRVLFGRSHFDRELEEEMQFHMALKAEEHRQNGMSSREAQTAARRQFGNTLGLREAGWDAWGWAPLERFMQDVKFAVRTLRRSPGFTTSVILLLAVAIGMNTTVFSVIHAVMLAPLPYDRPDELVRLYETNVAKGQASSNVSPNNFLDWRADSHSFEELAVIEPEQFDIYGDDGPEHVRAAHVTPGFFKILCVQPAIGRQFLPEEYQVLTPDLPTTEGMTVAIISYRLWQKRFAGSPEVIGATMKLGNILGKTAAVRIVGVMPAGFGSAGTTLGPLIGSLPLAGPDSLRKAAGTDLGSSDIWLPRTYAFAESKILNDRWAPVIARRLSGISNRQAQAEMDLIAKRLEVRRPDANSGWGVRIVPLRETVAGGYRTSLLILAGAVGLVLLIACANVANLMLARGASRMREMASRTAMGATRLRLVLQLAAESVVLSLTAGALGFGLAAASVRAVIALAPTDLPRISETGINGTVLGFCISVALATGLLCGVVPALRTSGVDLNTALKDGGTASAGRALGLLARALIVLEVTVSLVLLVGAGLLARSFASSQTRTLGFQTDHILGVNLSLSQVRREGQMPYDREVQLPFYQELLSRLGHTPGIEAAAMGSIPPASWSTASFDPEGKERFACVMDFVSARYFQALRVPLVAGRFFSESDDDRGPHVVIINQTTARLAWPGEGAVGKRLSMDTNGKLMTVVGVINDLSNSNVMGGNILSIGSLNFNARGGVLPEVYIPMAQSSYLPWPWGSLVIRIRGSAVAVAPAVWEMIHALDSRVTVTRAATVEERLASSTAALRFNTLVMSVFATLAFVLAASGLYSLMSYTVSLRTREISIRMALGADRAGIVATILRHGAVLAGTGVALGLAVAWGASRLLSAILYQVKPLDPAAFFGATVLLLLATLAACIIPARRAASVDIVETLRQE
jgi:putative ABC transport system permease protein